MQNDDFLGALSGAVWVAVFIGFMIWVFSPDSWMNSVWYSVSYHVALGKVHIDKKPSDCDWTHAPLGNKGCRYKATVTAYNSAGMVVGGDGAPKYSTDPKGHPIISYNDGKTWDWFAGDISDLKVNSWGQLVQRDGLMLTP
jgi:hypothetical protein